MTGQKIIGERFEIGDQLGQGGMATVYFGKDTVTGEQVAIKLLKSEIIAAAPDIVERFQRKGEALRRLNHPQYCQSVGDHQRGRSTICGDGICWRR